MKIAIIGGAGRMGRWLTKYFVSKGNKVIVSDAKLEEMRIFAEASEAEFAVNNLKAAREGDLIVVSTPIQKTPTVISEITPHMRRGTVVAEISSIKSGVIEVLAKAAELGLRPLSIHPLFGPGAKDLKGRKIALVPVVNPEREAKLVEDMFPEADVIIVDADEHDRVMAPTLALTHFMNIVFASVLGEEDLMLLKTLGGTTFQLQITLAESVMTEDPALHSAIQIRNEHTLKYVNKFLSRAELIKKMIAKKDESSVIEFCKKVQSLFYKDAEHSKAYEKMYRILDVLQ
jgi:prephenate dehydrogenase